MSPGPTRPRRRLSAMVVNYNTGAFAEVAIASLRVEWRREGRHMDDLEIVLVDNNSPQDQSEFLERIEASGVTVLRSKDNLGYAGGMNLAFEHTCGEPTDIVALLNPDLYFLPGSIAALMDYVAENPDVGAADPRTYFDPGKRLQLPRNLLPTLFEHAFELLAALCAGAARVLAPPPAFGGRVVDFGRANRRGHALGLLRVP
ncbi:MAG: glycosyltransferase [Planctomycetaceae bacterium]|nr:glycosyltransferase [Planctomycetaceae bacterium]